MNGQTMNGQTTGARVPYADDSATGLPMYRNGEAVRAAIPTANGRYLILVERACFEFVTAVTDSGRDGWDNGHYHPFAIPGRPVSAGKRADAYARALADLLGRAAMYLDDTGREAFRADLRGYVSGLFNFDPCERCTAADRADAEAATFGRACGSDPRGGYACALGHFHVPAGYTDADARDADYRLAECDGAA